MEISKRTKIYDVVLKVIEILDITIILFMYRRVDNVFGFVNSDKFIKAGELKKSRFDENEEHCYIFT